MKKFASFAFCCAAIGLMLPHGVRAETRQQVNAISDEMYVVTESFNQKCEPGSYARNLSDECGARAERVICSVNAYAAIIQRSNVGREFTDDLAFYFDELAAFSEYFEAMMGQGKMVNPAKMSSSEQVRYCREIGAPVRR
jgi:hypothetical protein